MWTVGRGALNGHPLLAARPHKGESILLLLTVIRMFQYRWCGSARTADSRRTDPDIPRFSGHMDKYGVQGLGFQTFADYGELTWELGEKR